MNVTTGRQRIVRHGVSIRTYVTASRIEYPTRCARRAGFPMLGA